MANLIALEFEVFGKVQGVFFRKFTAAKAKDLGLFGWCRNTQDGTVAGVLEGKEDKIKEMKQWLLTTGSPQSRITKADFRNEHPIQKYVMSKFEVRK